MKNLLISSALQLLNAALLVSWLVLSLIAVIGLSKRNLHSTPKALWTLIILCVPILGAVAFFIIRPEDE